MFGERIAIVFITASLLLGGGLGYAVVADYNATKNLKGAATAGTTVTTDVGPSAEPSAAAAATGTGGGGAPPPGPQTGEVPLPATQPAPPATPPPNTPVGLLLITPPPNTPPA